MMLPGCPWARVWASLAPLPRPGSGGTAIVMCVLTVAGLGLLSLQEGGASCPA